MTAPHVSVLMIAYNVENYIAQALDSVLMQEVDFDYEIVVGEDASTDRTRDILMDYARRHSDRIRLILRERNIGMNANFAATFLACTGRYVALLDGDDYWNSPLKLQRQADFLDAHPECTVCFHNVMVVYDDGQHEAHPFHMTTRHRRISARVPKPVSGLKDLVTGNFLQTGSVMYRGGTVRKLPEWFLTMPTFDWPLHVLHAERGHVAYIDEVLATYRVHAGGFWSTGMSQYRTVYDVDVMLQAFETLNRHLGYKFDSLIRTARSSLYCRRADALIRNARHQEARSYAVRAVLSSSTHFGRKQRRAFKLIVKSILLQLRQRFVG
jgi:glycosyltransferase involved in cell wall biosynthesis